MKFATNFILENFWNVMMFSRMSYIINRDCLAVFNPQIEFLEMYIKETIKKSIIDIIWNF